MRRLNRLREERGAMAVFVALLMPILFGLAAIAIDTSAIWSARQQTQSGADAAVIAVAMECARGSCGGAAHMKATAEAAYWANNEAAKAGNLGPGEGWISASSQNGRSGTVHATQKTNWVVNHFFASALGYDTGELSVDSHAAWAPAASGRADAPVGISWCVYNSAVGNNGPRPGATATIPLTTQFTGSCAGPKSGTVAGGTALTAANVSGCRTTSTLGESVPAVTGTYGGALGSGCTTAHLSGLVGADIVVPVWDAVSGQNGSSPTFRVYGYAAFRVTGHGASGLTGYFTRAARQVDASTPPPTTAPDLGARAVFLTDH